MVLVLVYYMVLRVVQYRTKKKLFFFYDNCTSTIACIVDYVDMNGNVPLYAFECILLGSMVYLPCARQYDRMMVFRNTHKLLSCTLTFSDCSK